MNPSAEAPVNGRSSPEIPATAAAARTASAAWAARRAIPRASWATSGTSASSPSGASNGPARNSSPQRASRQDDGDPAEREQSVQDRGTLGDVAERKERSGQSDREADARHPPGGECGDERDGDDERGWPERKQRRSERSAQRCQTDRSETASEHSPWAG